MRRTINERASEMTKIRSILVGSDLSPASDAVVAAAAAIAAAKGAELHILHAFDFPSGAGGEASASSFPDRVAKAERDLDAQVQRVVSPTGASVASRRVEIFVAHRAIAEAAEGVGADLVVVGAHSHRRMGDELLGSTADRVVRASEVPCLVVRAPLELPLRTVVAPVDRSEASQGALALAMDWAVALGREDASTDLTVLHVLPRALDIPEFSLDPANVGQDLRREIEAARASAGAPGTLRVREEVRWGDTPVDEILTFASERSADLLVVGTHGEGVIKRFLIGSVASGVARRAPCPVLLVPPAKTNAV